MKPRQRIAPVVMLAILTALVSIEAHAQLLGGDDRSENLPPAPSFNPAKIDGPPQNSDLRRTLVAPFPTPKEAQSSTPGDQPPAPTINTGGAIRLTRTQAEQLAIKNNPRISVGHLLAVAQHQIYREARAAELPTFNGALTAVDANEGSRLAVGTLNASHLLVHAGAGIEFNQLITDFGRTLNLVAAAKLREKAQNANSLATTEDIVLATDQAFYNALQAQALLKVAQQTVATRQSVEDQVNELLKNELRSTLDLSFAQVNLSQAKMLQLDAQSNVDSTTAALTAILGSDKRVRYDLVDDNTQITAPPPDIDALLVLALKQRPDLQAFQYNQSAADKFRRAQYELRLPTVSAMGVAGATPVRPDCVDGCSSNYFTSSWFGAIGVNMNIPIFNGFLFSAQASQAAADAKAAAENTRDLRDSVVRDVQTAWLAANTAFQRISVAAEQAKEADMSLNLAHDRYQLGLGSIVELSEAQLQQANAAIQYVNVQYQYRLALSTLDFEIGAQP